MYNKITRTLVKVMCVKAEEETFEDTTGAIRSKKDRQYNSQKKMTKGQTIIYTTLHRNIKK